MQNSLLAACSSEAMCHHGDDSIVAECAPFCCGLGYFG